MDLTCLGWRQKREQSEKRERRDFIISAKLMASSTPGIAKARSCIIEPIMPFWSADEGRTSEHDDKNRRKRKYIVRPSPELHS